MRLVKIILAISIPIITIFTESVSASEDYNINFVNYGTSFTEVVYRDFNDYLVEKELDYFIVDRSRYSSYKTVYILFFNKNDSPNISLKDIISSNYRYLYLWNVSDSLIDTYCCELDSRYYHTETHSYSKEKCFTSIDNFVSGQSKYIMQSNNRVTNRSDFNVFEKSGSFIYYPFYSSYEEHNLILEPDFSVSYLDINFDITNLTTKHLFYANHNNLFLENDSSNNSFDLKNIEILLYFICFILFAFFIFFVFKIAIKFIHIILPI